MNLKKLTMAKDDDGSPEGGGCGSPGGHDEAPAEAIPVAKPVTPKPKAPAGTSLFDMAREKANKKRAENEAREQDDRRTFAGPEWAAGFASDAND